MNFNQSKYTKWYFAIIENARENQEKGYTELHHIIPRCMGGTDHVDNLIRLSARQHFVCHMLLTQMTSEEYKNKMTFALWRMLHSNIDQKRYIVGSHQYKTIKEQMAKAISENNKNQVPWNKGKKIGNNPWNKGKTGVMSAEARRKISEARKLMTLSEEARLKISQSVKKTLHTEETKKKMRDAAKNRRRRGPLTAEQKTALSIAMKNSWEKRKSV